MKVFVGRKNFSRRIYSTRNKILLESEIVSATPRCRTNSLDSEATLYWLLFPRQRSARGKICTAERRTKVISENRTHTE